MKAPQRQRTSLSPSTDRRLQSPVRLRWIALGVAGLVLTGGSGYLAGVLLQQDEPEQQVRTAEYQPAPPPLAPRASWPEFATPPASEEPPPEPHPSAQPAPVVQALAKSAPQIASLPPVQTPPAPPSVVALPPIPEGPEGEAPWLRFAQAPRTGMGKPEIAIVIDDMGLDRRRSARAIALPAPLTLSFLPYAEDLREQAASGRAHGHELLVHVPMEPLGSHNDAGPGALKVGLSLEEVGERLRHDLGQFDQYVGINNHMGSRFTAYGPGMAVVMAELKSRGLLFLDSRTIGNTVGAPTADQYGVPNIERDVFLDDVMTESAVRTELAHLEAIAARTGHAVAIGHPHDQTLAVLTRWIPEVQAKGFVLVPLSQLVRERQPAAVPVAAAAKNPDSAPN